MAALASAVMIKEEFRKLAFYAMRQVVARVKQIEIELTAVGISAKHGDITIAEAIREFEEIVPGCLPAAYQSMFEEEERTVAAELQREAA
jgi:hypothetical protein